MMLGLCAAPASASEHERECFSGAGSARIDACTRLIEGGGLGQNDLALAHATRALALSLSRRFVEAMPDYDRSLDLDPGSPVVWNNRAWARFRLGELAASLDDVDRSLSLDARNPHAFDTRAHVRQLKGEWNDALADYSRAMTLGGNEFVRLYQCGLRAAGHYHGGLDGIRSSLLDEALRACVVRSGCDPLPPGEDCVAATS